MRLFAHTLRLAGPREGTSLVAALASDRRRSWRALRSRPRKRSESVSARLDPWMAELLLRVGEADSSPVGPLGARRRRGRCLRSGHTVDAGVRFLRPTHQTLHIIDRPSHVGEADAWLGPRTLRGPRRGHRRWHHGAAPATFFPPHPGRGGY